MRKYIWSLVLVLMVSSSNLFSQPTLCPPLEYGVKWSKFKAEATTRTNNGKENSGTVEYWISENYEIVFDWTTFKNNNPFLDDETVKELLIAQLVSRMGSTDGNEVKIISKTPCTVDLKCVLNVDKNYTGLCCDDPNLPPNTYDTFDGKKAIDVWHTVECGYKCCQQRYLVKGSLDHLSNRWYSYIEEKYPIEPMPGSNCNSSTTYYDCTTGQPKTCEGYCK